MDAPRRTLLRIYRAALDAVDGRRCVRDALAVEPPAGSLRLVALGKAAAAMAEGAFDACGESIAAGLLITKTGHVDPGVWRERPVRIFESAHPVPDQRSLDAGAALLNFIDAAPLDVEFLFLLSGGASSLAEVLPPEATLADLEALNHYLLGSGLDIHAVNRLRIACSQLKGGRLARRLAGRRARVLLISDVEGDDPGTIGSGPLSAGPLSAGRRAPVIPDELPAALRHLLAAEPTPVADDPAFRRITHQIVASNAQALAAAAARAEVLGLPVHRYPQFVKGEAAAAGEALACALRDGAPGVHLWGGEPTVTLPPQPGRGGRMQALALAAARVLDGRPDLYLLAAGTDGSDGPTEDAGALVDGGTVTRCRDDGIDPVAALTAADAGSALDASGDLVHTGPTGTNVMDIMIGLREGGVA